MASQTTTSDDTKRLSQAAVLVVDDSNFMTELVTRILRSMPVGKILTASSAEDAFYNLEKGDAVVDVMILDYGLRGMNGLQFLEKLRGHKKERLQKLPVIMLTAHNDMELYQRLAHHRIAAYLIKPVSNDLLKSALERALQGHLVTRPAKGI